MKFTERIPRVGKALMADSFLFTIYPYCLRNKQKTVVCCIKDNFDI